MTGSAPYHETTFKAAIQHWWNSKTKNTGGIGKSQGGTRDANLAGDTMDGFRDALIHHIVEAGIDRGDIFSGGHFAKIPANLPSYFRISKNWDVLVCKNSLFKKLSGESSRSVEEEPQLIAAIEFKSQEDSIGNNQNNRMEESIGNAADFWASYENKNFVRLQPRPWLGYLFVGKYEDASITKGVKIKQPHFLTDPAFVGSDPGARLNKVTYEGPSYAERYRIFLERMMAKKYYDGACFITTNDSIKASEENYRCLFPELSGARFLDGLMRHVKAYYF